MKLPLLWGSGLDGGVPEFEDKWKFHTQITTMPKKQSARF